jgi:hypothetical protein
VGLRGVYCSTTGKIGGLASVEVRSQHHIFSPPLAWAKTAEASGFGVHTEPKPKPKPHNPEEKRTSPGMTPSNSEGKWTTQSVSSSNEVISFPGGEKGNPYLLRAWA